MKPGTVIWDWKAQPDWAEINRHLARFQRARVMPRIFEIELDSDDCGIVVAPASWTQRMAQQHIDAEWREER